MINKVLAVLLLVCYTVAKSQYGSGNSLKYGGGFHEGGGSVPQNLVFTAGLGNGLHGGRGPVKPNKRSGHAALNGPIPSGISGAPGLQGSYGPSSGPVGLNGPSGFGSYGGSVGPNAVGGPGGNLGLNGPGGYGGSSGPNDLAGPIGQGSYGAPAAFGSQGSYGGQTEGAGYGGQGIAEPGMPYDFQYQVNDPLYGGNFGHSQRSDGNTVSGRYFVQLPDGRLQTVEFRSDPYSGYVADVQYQGEAQYPSSAGYGGEYSGGSNVAGGYSSGSGFGGGLGPVGKLPLAAGPGSAGYGSGPIGGGIGVKPAGSGSY